MSEGERGSRGGGRRHVAMGKKRLDSEWRLSTGGRGAEWDGAAAQGGGAGAEWDGCSAQEIGDAGGRRGAE